MSAGPATQLIEAPAVMAPAEDRLDGIALSRATVSGIIVDVQDSGEAVEVDERPLGLAVGHIDIVHTGRVRACRSQVNSCCDVKPL